LKSFDNSIVNLPRRFSNIIILGMGASGVVGDFVNVLLRNSSIPVYVQKSSRLPNFAGSDSLVVTISYSGKTRETLDALNTAISLGAKNLVMTSSYDLGAVCAGKGIPWIPVPENGFPRASLGYMLVSILGVLNKIGIAPSFESDVSEAIEVLNDIRHRCGPEVSDKSNPARLLALSMIETFPIIYGEADFTEVAALRWKQQINENAKTHCYYDVFPELLHNEIEAWHLESGREMNYTLLLLRDSIHEKEAGLEEKITAAKRLAETKGAKVHEVWTRGKSEFARLMSLCYLGDYVSLYLALSRGVDPGPVHNIEHLKKVSVSNTRGDNTYNGHEEMV
jgi:glucose/mannose-6-phosphate isomerase